MNRFFFTFACCVMVFLFSHCQSKSSSSETGADTSASSFPDMHNAQNALDWGGTYKGTLPCADCIGIETTITIHDDLTYSLSRIYLQKENGAFEETGTFSWDQSGSTIKLSGDGGQYFVGENSLFLLNEEGNRITGELADHYILKKKSTVNQAYAITDIYWRLEMLDGQAIETPEGSREIHFTLTPEDSSIRGFAGCNGFGGGYIIESENRIMFSQLISTKMACSILDTENKFMKALEATRGFKIETDELWLLDSNNNLIAQFKASNNE